MLALSAALATVALPGLALADDLPVTQEDKQFQPGEVAIKPGDAIVFKNDVWIVDGGSRAPRLVTAYPREEREQR